MKNEKNYEIFRECVAGAIVKKSTKNVPAKPKRKYPKAGKTIKAVQTEFQPSEDSEELADFIDVPFTKFQCSVAYIRQLTIEHSI